VAALMPKRFLKDAKRIRKIGKFTARAERYFEKIVFHAKQLISLFEHPLGLAMIIFDAVLKTV
jgi:hypothetical protein